MMTPCAGSEDQRYITNPPERSSLNFKESYAMHKLEVSIWGIKVNAEGIIAIGAALVIVLGALAVYRF
jgi:hypothetical protein